MLSANAQKSEKHHSSAGRKRLGTRAGSRRARGTPSGDAIHTIVLRPATSRPAGPVRTWASPDVRCDSTTRGTAPNRASPLRDAPSSTGRRPERSIEVTTSSRVTAGAPATDAAGWPHSPRTTWLNMFVVVVSTKTTLASVPIAEHSLDTAASEPP